MTITDLSPDMSIMNTSSQVGVAVLAKAMDAEKTSGAAMVNMMNQSMMEQSVNPHIGSNFDMKI